MDPRRPDPDALLKRAQEEETSRRPRKTENLLWRIGRCRKNLCHAGSGPRAAAARVSMSLAGYVETHRRTETEALMRRDLEHSRARRSTIRARSSRNSISMPRWRAGPS